MDQQTFQKELTALGGFNPRGEPILRVVRGDEEKKFACGRWIPKYFVPYGAVGNVERKFRKRHIFTNTVEEISRDEAKEIWERNQTKEFTEFHVETSQKVTLTPTAREGFFIEQWIPPEKIRDTPESWERGRFRMWWDAERGGAFLTDMVGPFPSEGQYDNFLHTMELTESVLQKVKLAWRRREQWEPKTPQQTVKEIFEQAKEMEEKPEELLVDQLVDALAPIHFRGVSMTSENPRKSNKRTKFGRAK